MEGCTDGEGKATVRKQKYLCVIWWH